MNGSEQWEWQQDEWMNMLIYEIKTDQIVQIVQIVKYNEKPKYKQKWKNLN